MMLVMAGKCGGPLTAPRGVSGGESRAWEQYRPDNGRRNGVGQFGHVQKAFNASGADPDVRDLLQDINTVRTAVLGVQGGNEVENGGELVELQRQVKM